MPTKSRNGLMRRRPSARLLVVNDDKRVLLFRFVHKSGPLAGQDYWATPGGGLEENETFEQAAIRELAEETGIKVNQLGATVGQREFVLQLPSGEHVMADERFFVVRVSETILSRSGWTAQETTVMKGHRWWSCDELTTTDAVVWPDDLANMLETVGE